MTMKRSTCALVAAATMIALVLTEDTSAWGPRAQLTITTTALQVVRRTYPDVFRTEDNNYEPDLFAGATAGVDALRETLPLNSVDQAIDAVGREIQLLRKVRAYGTGSYFAYRMGVLSALAADIILPFALETKPPRDALRRSIEADIEAHFHEYGFDPPKTSPDYIRFPEDYFEAKRVFVKDDRRILADDYASGRGYDGLLEDAGQVYFQRAVESGADAWFTVLKPSLPGPQIAVSDRALTWYFVSEIEYLLGRKRNTRQAERVYEHFQSVNPGIPEAYNRIGDAFYRLGTPSTIERGVQEWTVAQSYLEPGRQPIVQKLAAHYIRRGNELLDAAAQPGGDDSDLSNALENFKLALEYEPTNEIAAQRIRETNIAIVRRNELRDFYLDVMAKADTVMEQAERSAFNNDFGGAIATYNQAQELYSVVQEQQQFEKLRNTAEENMKEILSRVRDITSRVIENAQDAIAAGDEAKERQQFNEAINAYETVKSIVSVIPGDATTRAGKEREDMVQLAEEKIHEAKIARQRWEEEQAARQAAGAA